jgi:prephenate dehydrogenase
VSETVFIIGLGLIGGSISLTIKETKDVSVLGFDQSEDRVKEALTLQVVDEQVESIRMGAEKADLIVIAVPVQQTLAVLKELSLCKLKNDVLITDVGSTKGKITEYAHCLEEKGITFIGGHPMAGSHKSGVSAARKHLFENAFYILTPSQNTSDAHVNRLKNWLKGTNANFVILSAEEHDKIAGGISHFPHIIAASLVHQIEVLNHTNPLTTRLAAGGFRDITRIASSNPSMWKDILVHNRDTLLTLFDHWQVEMEKIRSYIEEIDDVNIFQYFKEAKAIRDGMPQKQVGAIPSFYDMYVDVPDYPGIISEVTGILAEDRISITNIRIIETREDILGVLRLSFRTEEDRKRASICLEERNYATFLST